MILIFLLACANVVPENVEAAVETEAPGDIVHLSATARQNAQLRIETLAQTPLVGTGIAPARIALDPRREAHVSAVMGGQLERILVRPGDRVLERATLATVLSPDLGEAVGAHLAALARKDAAKARQERISQLLSEGVSSRSQLADAEAEYTIAAAEAEATEERLRVFGVEPASVLPSKGQHFSSRFSIRSPIAGEVLTIDAALGRSVEPGDALFHIGNLDEVWLIAEVYERDLASVKVGSQMSFTMDAYGDEVFAGSVDQVSGWLDPESRTAEVRVVVANPEHRLKPNMFAKARLTLSEGPVLNGIALPADAVQMVAGQLSAFVEVEEGSYAVRGLRVEPLPDGRVQVLAGLAVGDRVVMDGAFTLKSELAKGELEGE